MRLPLAYLASAWLAVNADERRSASCLPVAVPRVMTHTTWSGILESVYVSLRNPTKSHSRPMIRVVPVSRCLLC